MAKELDYMEYASDAAAQATYVSSGVGAVTSFSDTHNGDSAAWVNYTLRSVIGNAQISISGSKIRITVQAHSTGTTKIDKCYIGHKAAAGDPWDFDGNQVEVTFDGGSGFEISAGATKVSDWIDFALDSSKDLVIAFDWTNDSAKDDGSRLSTGYNSYYKANADEAHLTAPDGYTTQTGYLHIIIKLEVLLLDLQCYSEDTIKTQGSYSLKAVAIQTGSLNDTLTRTVSPTIDLSGVDKIKLDIRASRTGSNFKIAIHDSGGTTTEHTVNIISADIFQTDEWDISGIADADKDAIDQIIIEVSNADADNTFYIDNFRDPDEIIQLSVTTLALTIPAPTILYDYTYQPSFLSLIGDIQVPTVIEGTGIIVSPSVIASILTLFAATITGYKYKNGTSLEWTRNYNLNYYRRSIALATYKNIEEFEREGGTWADFGSYFSLATNPVVASKEYFDSEEIDMGTEIVGSVQLEQHITDEVGDAEVIIYWRYGTSSPLSGDYLLFAVGDFTFRYAQLRIYLKSNSPYSGNVYLNDLILEVDVFDVVDGGASVTIAIGGTTISFNEDFQVAPAITITSQDSPLTPKITEESKDSFKCTVYDKDGNDVGGIIDWVSSGY